MKHAITGKTTPTTQRAPIVRPAPETEDADNPRTTVADWEGATMKVGGVLIGHTPVRRRGPGKKPARQPIQLRLPPETLARWKATGPGWQTRMAEALDRVAP